MVDYSVDDGSLIGRTSFSLEDMFSYLMFAKQERDFAHLGVIEHLDQLLINNYLEASFISFLVRV